MVNGMQDKVRNFEITDIKRINLKGQYYDRVSYEVDGEQKYFFYKWYSPESESYAQQQARGGKIKFYRIYLENRDKDKLKEDFLEKKKYKVHPTATKNVVGNPFYQSFIKIFLVIRYKNHTPFYFPEKGDSNAIVYSNNYSETQMLKLVLQNHKYQEMRYWIERAKSNSNISINYGWTYKRVYSRTGSFNGDTVYLNWDEVRFNGTNRGIRINHLKGLR